MKIFNRKLKPSNELNDNNYSKNDSLFSETCNLVRTQREKYGISLEMLSRKTRISIIVLEAIENGKKENLPEKTYLKQMLKAIEFELGLPKNKLEILLESSKTTTNTNKQKIFAPGNINIFASWEGNIIYFILMIISIITLNKYQNFLSETNTLDTTPIENKEVILDNEKISTKE